MNIKELRLGNYILRPETPFEAVELNISILFYYKEDLLPIPLTEEWLLKFGFYWDVKKVYLCLNKTQFRVRYSYNTITLFQNGNYVSIPNIKYVHQLQNLYFALTGEELTIK